MVFSQKVRLILITTLAVAIPVLIYNKNYDCALAVSTIFAIIEVINALMISGFIVPM